MPGGAARQGQVYVQTELTLRPLRTQVGAKAVAPSNIDSIKALLFSGWLNVLLVAVPLSFLSHFLKWGKL